MLCNVTGTLYLPNGQLAKSRTLRFKRVDQKVKAEYLGAVVPDDVYTQSNNQGEVDFEILTGVYMMHVEGGYSVRAIVPDAATAYISDIIEAAAIPPEPPVWYQQALNARDEAVDAADMAEVAADDAQAAADALAGAIDDIATAQETADDALAGANSAIATQARRDFGKWHLVDYLHPDDMSAALAGDTASQDEARVTAAIQQMNDDAMDWWRGGNYRTVRVEMPPAVLAINDEYFSQQHAGYVWDLPHANNRWIISSDGTILYLKNWTGRAAVRTTGYYAAQGISYPVERAVLRWERSQQNGVFPEFEGNLTIRSPGSIDNDPVGVKFYNGAEIKVGKIRVVGIRNHQFISEGLFNGSIDSLSLDFGGYQPTEFGGDYGHIPYAVTFANIGAVVTASEGIFTAEHVGKWFGLAQAGPASRGIRLSHWSPIASVDSPTQITLAVDPDTDAMARPGSFEAMRASVAASGTTWTMTAALGADMTGRLVTLVGTRGVGKPSTRGTLTTRVLSHSGNTLEVADAAAAAVTEGLLVFSPQLLVDQIASSPSSGLTDNISFTAPRIESARWSTVACIPAVFGAYATGSMSDAKLHGAGTTYNNFGGSASNAVLGQTMFDYSGTLSQAGQTPRWGCLTVTGGDVSVNINGQISGYPFGTHTALVYLNPVSSSPDINVRMGAPLRGTDFPQANQVGVRLGPNGHEGMVVSAGSDARGAYGAASIFPTRLGRVIADEIDLPHQKQYRTTITTGSESWKLPLVNQSNWVVTGSAVCREIGGSARRGFTFSGMIGRSSGASSVGIVGTPTVTTVGTVSAPGHDVALTADTVLGALSIDLTGSGTWMVDVTIAEARV